jgi:DNA polymerase III epsilon subunit-like protein
MRSIPINFNNFCVFDLETGGANPHKCEITQIGAVIVNRNSLKIIDEFEAKMKPEDTNAIEDGALQATGFTREQIATFPETAIVWPTFVNWVNKHNKKNNVYNAPIPAGYNIIGYDMPIIRRYCKKYKTAWDEERQDQKLFSQVYKFDVLDHMWYWFENNPDLEKLKIEYLLRYLGFPEDIVAGSHDAINDTKNIAKVMIRLIKMARHMTEPDSTGKRKLEMRGALANEF